ncbi:endonuclease/exonuclease/phosphatase family protein [Kitasatospora sp. CMC57]|uniref:Endonuclease/exonuclease/phosphatase family protein n=1 Tax=Kitasatospora sp. CMC57 TaxID=3231513 RepID=A0AB33JPC7_9ACTN
MAGTALLVAVLLWPGMVPNRSGRMGSLLETFLPWLGLALPVLLVLALLRRSATAGLAVAVAAVVWAALFLPPAEAGGSGGLTVVQHNVDDANPDPTGTARTLADSGADLIALEELLPERLADYQAVLGAGHPYRAVEGTVGLWSRYPLTDVRPVDLRPRTLTADWRRALRATLHTAQGETAVYVVHLPSVRLGPGGYGTDRRDESARLLAAALAAEPLPRLIVLGDFNGTLDDRGLAPLTDLLGEGGRRELSWPRSFPLARIDHVLTRSAKVSDGWTLPPTPSDHLPVAARIDPGRLG